MHDAEHFAIDRFTRWMFLALPWLFSALTVAGLALPFLPDDGKPRNVSFEQGLSVVITLFFGTLAWFSWRVVRELPHAPVSLDKQGIWKAALGRDSTVVHWSDITGVRERQYLQRLELLGRSGTVLLKLEYQLHDFARLRGIVLERAALESPRPMLGHTFARGIVYHVFNTAALVGFAALGIFLAQTNPILGAALLFGVVGFGGWEYLNAVYKLELQPTEMVLSWPLRRLTLSRHEILGASMGDHIANHARHPQVLLSHSKSQKPVVLRGLGASAVELQRSIRAWQSNAA